MTKPKKRVKDKTPEELETLTNDEVMQRVFGTKGQQVLKDELLTHEGRPKNDYRIPPQ
jgi:hypothetical protein